MNDYMKNKNNTKSSPNPFDVDANDFFRFINFALISIVFIIEVKH